MIKFDLHALSMSLSRIAAGGVAPFRDSNHIRVTCRGDNQFHLSTRSQDMSIDIDCGGVISGEGEFLVDLPTVNLLKSITPEEDQSDEENNKVTISCNDSGIHIEAKGCSFDIPTLCPSTFPTYTSEGEGINYRTTISRLVQMVDPIAKFAGSSKGATDQLVQFRIGEDSILLDAMTQVRSMQKGLHPTGDHWTTKRVYRKACLALLSMLKELPGDKEIVVRCCKNFILFESVSNRFWLAESQMGLPNLDKGYEDCLEFEGIEVDLQKLAPSLHTFLHLPCDNEVNRHSVRIGCDDDNIILARETNFIEVPMEIGKDNRFKTFKIDLNVFLRLCSLGTVELVVMDDYIYMTDGSTKVLIALMEG